MKINHNRNIKKIIHNSINKIKKTFIYQSIKLLNLFLKLLNKWRNQRVAADTK